MPKCVGKVGFAFVTWGVLAVLAAVPEAQAQFELMGYADLEWVATETDDPADEWHNFFDNHHFNLI